MELQELNPFIRYCNIHPQPILYSEMVRAYDCRIFFTLQGSGTFYIDNATYHFEKNSLVYIPSGTKYCFSYEKNTDTTFLILNFDIISNPQAILTKFFSVSDPAGFNETKVIAVPNCPYFSQPIFIHNFSNAKKDLLSIYDYFINKPYLYSEQASGLLKTILIQTISVQHTESKTSFAQLTQEVLAFIRTHYAEPLTNQIIADKFGFHSYYLNRVIKEETGQNLHNYLLNYRIKEAQTLLSTSTLSIQHIARLTGFGSPSQFSVAFKKVIGMTPLQYREENNMCV